MTAMQKSAPRRRCEARSRKGRADRRCGTYSAERFCPAHETSWRLAPPEECPVCLEPLEPTCRPLQCGHFFHRSCVSNLVTSLCPLCRVSITRVRRKRKADADNPPVSFLTLALLLTISSH